MDDAEYGNSLGGLVDVDPYAIGKGFHRMSPQSVGMGRPGIRVLSRVFDHCLNIVEESLDLEWCDTLIVRNSLANVLDCER